MALGSPFASSTSLVARIFTPLILPLLVLLASVAYLYAEQHCLGPRLNDGAEVTRPLITEVGGDGADDDGDWHLGFGDLSRTRPQEHSTNVEADGATAVPTSSYGAT